jgi:hypothetical protein
MSAPRPIPSAPGRTLILGVFTLLMGVACVLPALVWRWQGQEQIWRGFYVLVVGALGIREHQYAWLANPLAVAAVVMCLKGIVGWARFASLAAVVVGLHTLSLFGKTVPLGEQAFNSVQLTDMGPGFWAWLVALASPFILSFVPMQLPPVEREEDDSPDE